VIIIAPGYGGGYYAPPPPPPRPVRLAVPPAAPTPPPPKWHGKPTRWGLNLRVEGMTFGHNDDAAKDSGMGGLGISLRYRPIPHFAFDLGVDVLGGTDFNGFKRTETPLTLSGMLFLNPRSPVQVYLLGGMNYSHAEVSSDFASPLLSSKGDGTFGAEYSYFGGQLGAGLEFRVSRHVALNIDVVGFMRQRTDDGRLPEFSDPDKGTTNSSGGALLRGGLTFWW
jgi:opacity protein-like surface antigen